MRKKKSQLPRSKQIVLKKNNSPFTSKLYKLFPLVFSFFIIIILLLSIRGLVGNPTSTEINNDVWKDNGPLELSPERGRFALLYSIIEDHSLHFSVPIARFSSPDVAYLQGEYVSLFAPGVSFIVIPGYLLGKILGMSQVGAFFMISLFALANTLLLRKIIILLGIRPSIATISSCIFLFGTPAFSYSVTLYQHHISTFLLLGALYLVMRYKNIWSICLIWIACSASIAIDYPNLFLLFPVGIVAFFQLFSIQSVRSKIQLNINPIKVLTLGAIVIPMLFFFWFNYVSYHNPFQLSGTIERAVAINADGTPILEREMFTKLSKSSKEQLAIELTQTKSAVAFFKTRNLLNGMYEHFLSKDRGMLYFTPIMLIGFIGMVVALKNNVLYAPLFTAVITSTILLYSLWGDPYGGWAFGSRYLIPAYAMLSIFIAYLLDRWQQSLMFLLLILLLTFYSVSVNTLGALTSNRNPPQVEVLGLEKITKRPEKYTFMRNVSLLDQNISKSLVFQTFAKNSITAWQYFLFITSSILIPIATGFTYLAFTRKESYVLKA